MVCPIAHTLTGHVHETPKITFVHYTGVHGEWIQKCGVFSWDTHFFDCFGGLYDVGYGVIIDTYGVFPSVLDAGWSNVLEVFGLTLPMPKGRGF